MFDLSVPLQVLEPMLDARLATGLGEVADLPQLTASVGAIDWQRLSRSAYFPLAFYATLDDLLSGRAVSRQIGVLLQDETAADRLLVVLGVLDGDLRLLQLTRGPGPEAVASALTAIDSGDDSTTGQLELARCPVVGFLGWLHTRETQRRVWPAFPGRCGLPWGFSPLDSLWPQ